jgi:hypothetical protein
MLNRMLDVPRAAIGDSNADPPAPAVDLAGIQTAAGWQRRARQADSRKSAVNDHPLSDHADQA